MLLPAITAAWRRVPGVAAADRWLAGSVFSAFHAVITTPATQLLLLPGLALVCLIKYLFKYLPSLLRTAAADPDPQRERPRQAAVDHGDPSLTYTRKDVSAASAWSFRPGTDAVRPDDAAFDGLEALGYPYAPHYFTCFDLRVHYLDEPHTAPGPCAGTLVCLHGNPTWSFMYRHMIPNLTAAGYRVVALDFLGFGRSDKLLQTSDVTAELHATTVLALLEHLQLTDVTLVMHDWGAIFMQWCLPWLPTDRISRLVLLNTALPPHIFSREMGLANALLVAIWQATLIMKTMVPSLPLPVALGYGPPRGAAVVRLPRLGAFSVMSAGLLTRIRQSKVVTTLEAAVPGLSDVLDENMRNLARGEEARTFLRKHWVKPTLLMFGAPDPLFGSVQQRFTGQIINATALAYHMDPIFIKGAGHYPPETQPGRAAAEIIKFLRST